MKVARAVESALVNVTAVGIVPVLKSSASVAVSPSIALRIIEVYMVTECFLL
jgi:hypothetical protein